MVDYIKIQLNGIDINRLSNLPCLDFARSFSEKTGEEQNKKIAKYHQCKVTVYDSGTVYFSGSIHKMYNSLNNIIAPNFRGEIIDEFYKGFNGNQFTLGHVVEVQNHLAQLFDCNLEEMVVQNIELGVNAEISFNPKLFIDGLLYHGGKMFEFKHDGNFAKVVHQNFEIKIYNKSNQYKMGNSVLRYEVKFKKMKELKTTGIKTFKDINETNLLKASVLLLNRFNEVVYYDNTIYPHGLSKTQIKALDRYSNPRYWIHKLKPNQRFRHKEKLKEIIQLNSENLHLKIANEISKKCSVITQLFKRQSVA